MKLASRRFNLFIIILGALVFHSVCRIWISWYLLVIAIAIPLLSAAVSLVPMLRAVPSVDMNERMSHREKEYIRCGCVSRDPVFGYPPRCVMLVRVSYLGSDHSSDYEASLSAGEPMFIRVNTAHCTAVHAECVKVYTLDYFGVFKLRLKAPPAIEGVILPEPVSDEDRVEKTVEDQSEIPDNSSPRRSRELYELREYREGDALRDIHWKMTAKTGRVIVREGEKAAEERVAVALDLAEDLSENDGIAALALDVSCGLLDEGRPHSLVWYDGKGELRTAEAGDRSSQLRAVRTMLGDHPPKSGVSTSDARLEGYGVVMYIRPGEAEQG